MKVKELANQTNWRLYADEQSREKEIEGAFVGDLLSWVMGHSEPQQAWITVQAHLNVIAVAVLREFSCLILAGGSEATNEMIAQAQEEGLALFCTDLSAYEVCTQLHDLGI